MPRFVAHRALFALLLLLSPGLIYLGVTHLRPFGLLLAILSVVHLWRTGESAGGHDPPGAPPPPRLTTASLAAALGGEPWPDFDRVTKPEDRLAIQEILHPVQGRIRGFHFGLFLRQRHGFAERTSAIQHDHELVLVIFTAGPPLQVRADVHDQDLFGWRIELFPGAGMVLRAPPELAIRLWCAPAETAPLIRDHLERLVTRLEWAGAEPIAPYAVPIRAFARSKIWP